MWSIWPTDSKREESPRPIPTGSGSGKVIGGRERLDPEFARRHGAEERCFSRTELPTDEVGSFGDRESSGHERAFALASAEVVSQAFVGVTRVPPG